MGMACMGLTHCEECWKPLKMNEGFICNECEEKQNKKKKENKKIKVYKGYELIKAIADGEIKERK